MPIKSLEAFFFERSLANNAPLDTLAHARLGIDVDHYLSKLLNFKREPFRDAIGGFPATLGPALDADLEAMKQHDITPVFVFAGNELADSYKAKASKESTPAERHRSKSWQAYQAYSANSPTLPPPIDPFRDFQTQFASSEIATDLMRMLVERDIEFIRAPYFSWVQLGYLYAEECVDAIFGPTETALLPAVDKFILGMEFQNGEFRFIDKAQMFVEFHIDQPVLLDIAIAVGCDLQPSTLPIFAGFPTHSLFDMGLEIAQTGGSIYHQLVATGNEDAITKFQKGVIALHNVPVLKLNGKVEPTNADPPTDLHDLIGLRLPHEYYFYESVGLIKPRALDSVSNAKFIEREPLDGGLSSQYKSLVRATLAYKNKEVNLLTQNMARYFQAQNIKYDTYFESDIGKLDNRLFVPVSAGVSNIIAYSDKEDFSLTDFAKSLQDGSATFLAEPISKSNKQLIKNYEILSTGLLRTLHLLDVLSPKTENLKWEEAIKTIGTLDPTFHEEYLLFLLFLKYAPFSFSATFTPQPHGAPRSTDKKAREEMQLLSRLFLFVTTTHKHQYTGPLSRSLLSFRSCVDLIKSNTRELLECVLVNACVAGEVEKIDRANSEWRRLAAQIPFGTTTPSTVVAIMAQTILEQAQEKDYASAAKSVVDSFGAYGLVNPRADLKKGIRFAEGCFKLVEVLKKEKLVQGEETWDGAGKLFEELSKAL